MAHADMERLKADTSVHNALSETLKQAIEGFGSLEEAVDFLKTRGFDVSASELQEWAAKVRSPDFPSHADTDSGYCALMRFALKH